MNPRPAADQTPVRVPAGLPRAHANPELDLGFLHAERKQLKARLMLESYRVIKAHGLTQSEAGEILGISQPPVLTLMNGP